MAGSRSGTGTGSGRKQLFLAHLSHGESPSHHTGFGGLWVLVAIGSPSAQVSGWVIGPGPWPGVSLINKPTGVEGPRDAFLVAATAGFVR